MSLECGECERDLRGGHDISCSRYNLERGVALAICRVAGFDVDDEEFGLPPKTLEYAKAAIDLIRAVDAAKAPKKHLTLNLTDEEMAVLEDIAKRHELSRERTMIGALRTYQLFVEGHLAAVPDPEFAPPLSALTPEA